MIKKVLKKVNKKSKKVNISINIPEELLIIALLDAHKHDITFNQWCEKVLNEYIKKHYK